MNRACLLCVGSKESLQTLVENRNHSGKKDFMNYVFEIPLNEPIYVSAENLTPQVCHIMPCDEILHPGYCGEECRSLLLSHPEFRHEKDLYAIVGIECPGCGYCISTRSL